MPVGARTVARLCGPRLRISMPQTHQSLNSIANETAKCVNHGEGRVPLASPELHQNGSEHPWTAVSDDRKSLLLSSTLSRICRVFRAVVLALKPSPLVREILRELYNFPSRIGTIYATKPYLYGIPIGRLGGNHLHQKSNAQTLACMRDTQRISASHPWANLLDRHLFVEGWKAGAEWAFGEGRNLRSDSLHTDKGALDGSSERGGNFMPPPSKSATART
jgi:hypothetical protein